MFGVVPKVLWEKTNPADDKNRIEMALRLCLIRGRGRVVLVDSGIGEKWDEKQRQIYAIRSKALNIDPLSVTDVVLSHLHFDHVGGATGIAEGKPYLTFPNAKCYIQKANLSHAHAPTEKDRASFLENTIEPLVNSGSLVVLDGEKEISPGITIVVTQGHTPGHQLVKVSDEKTTLLCCGDTVPTASHIPIPWVMAYDLQPLVTMDEKRGLLERAATEKWILFYVHDPFVAATTVEESEGKFRRGVEVKI